MITRWTFGFILGTAIIWLTSPLFVRSYLPRQKNRGVLTLPVGESYRWRSEGYATSSIGEFGMVGAELTGPKGQPGRKVMTTNAKSPLNVALWGDSQAEGVCVGDAEKIHSLASTESGLTILPLARSGDDASDWLAQIAFAEKKLGAVAHVFLVTELSDLADAADPPKTESSSPATNAAIAWLPDFCIQGARNILTGDNGNSLRRLRFTLGPTKQTKTDRASITPSINWHIVLNAIQAASDRRIIIIYAPQIPQVLGNRIAWNDADEDRFSLLQDAAISTPIQVVDLRDQLIASADQGNWPHGFYNGRFGSGHLNEIGNQIIADALVAAIQNGDQ